MLISTHTATIHPSLLFCQLEKIVKLSTIPVPLKVLFCLKTLLDEYKILLNFISVKDIIHIHILYSMLRSNFVSLVLHM